MERIFRDLADVSVFLDNISIFSDSFEDHLQSLDIVLQRLQDNIFTVNPLKCKWAIQETEVRL